MKNLDHYEWELPNNDRIVIELSTVEHNRKNRNDLMNLWIKNGFMNTFLDDHINVETYYYDESGCHGWFNPQQKLVPNVKPLTGNRMVIDFDWILPDTEDNRKAIVDEVSRRISDDMKI